MRRLLVSCLLRRPKGIDHSDISSVLSHLAGPNRGELDLSLQRGGRDLVVQSVGASGLTQRLELGRLTRMRLGSSLVTDLTVSSAAW